MDFLQECAKRLDAGEEAEAVLATMRARYTTVRCLNVKTCMVRALCRPTPEHERALSALVAEHPEVSDALMALDRRDPATRALLASLPPRLPRNAMELRVTRAQMIECKRLGARSALEKNRKRVRVEGRGLLHFARGVIAAPGTATLLDLALSLMLLTGRRTCEVLNGTSVFAVDGAHALCFSGQAKKRGAADAYRIPTLAPAETVVTALATLRCMQHGEQRSNRDTSLCYQSALGRHLATHRVWAQCGKVHALRGLYACMALRLFDWEGDESDAFVAMCILGHAGLQESLVYTPFHLGTDFAEEATLGTGALTPPPMTKTWPASESEPSLASSPP